MQSLSHKEYGEFRSLYESVYDQKRFETVLDEFTDEDLLYNFSDEYIEESVEELFIECMTEGMTIDEVENILTESIESSIHLLNEKVDPKHQRKQDIARDRLATSRAMKSAASKSGDSSESSKPSRKEALKKVGSAVKKVASGLKKGAKAAGKAAQGGIGLAARAAGTAQRAGERAKSAAKSGYERGRQGAGGSSSGSSSSSSSSGSSDGGSSSSSSSGSSDEGSSSSAPAPRKRKDGLLKRGLKKLIRGVSKGVSAAAGAVKAGADSITDRARKEQMNYKDFKTIQELYNSIYEPQDVEELEAIEEDSRRTSNKQHTKRVRSNIKAFGSNYTPPSNYDPDANRGQGEVLTAKQMEKKRRKALRQEELEATGLFSEKEIEAIMEAEMIDENRAAMGRINKEYHRKKEAEAMAARSRDPKVKRDLPKRKNDNPMYDPKSAGSSRVSGFKFTPTEDVEYVDEDSRRMSNKQHTQRVRSNIKAFGSNYTPPNNYDPDANRGKGEVLTRKQIEKKRRKALRQEEVEAVDEGLTGERYKKALKKGKMYSRMVSADPEKRATRGGRGGESDFGAGDRGTGNKSRRRRGMSVGDED